MSTTENENGLLYNEIGDLKEEYGISSDEDDL